MTKPILCLDFDGVIHSYVRSWQDVDVIPDPPVPGAMAFIVEALEHFDVAVFSSRSNKNEGIYAMRRYIRQNMLDHMNGDFHKADAVCMRINYPTEKPPAMITLDDRALTFEGTWPTVAELKAFRPWNKRGSH